MGKENIGLIQVDGLMPNLALMKLHKWAVQNGKNPIYIDLSSIKCDQWFASKVFTGGSGYELSSQLPADIEELTPDYEAFKLDHSILFTSRGCIRKCDFCIVKDKEGAYTDVQGWEQQIRHTKVIVMDNNFLASDIWKEKLNYFIDNKIKVSFNQGLDIRLIDDEKAELLSHALYYDLKFRERRLYFAFDNVKLESLFREKLQILLKYIKNPRHIMVYVLAGYKDQTFEDVQRRFEIITSYGCEPFIMLYHNRDRKLNQYTRWVNKRIYKVNKDFNTYDPKIGH